MLRLVESRSHGRGGGARSILGAIVLLVDDFRIYQRGLTADDIAELVD